MSRITPATLLIIIFALLFGAVAAYVVRRQLIVQPVLPPLPEPTTVVPLASMDLEPGKPLTVPDVALIPMRRAEMATRKLPSDAIANPVQIIGRILRVPVKKGDAFTPDKFYPDGAGPSIAERLKAGYRAMTVAITGADAIAGFAVPGSTVDVLFRANAIPPDEPEETITLIQGAEILALGTNSVIGKLGGISPNSATNPVTLAVKNEDASKLLVVEGEGDILLTLRSPTDTTATNIPPLSLNDLLKRPQRLGPWVTDNYRRGSRQTLRFTRNQLVGEQWGGVPPQNAQPKPDAAPLPPPEPGPTTNIILPQQPLFSFPFGPLPIAPPMMYPNMQPMTQPMGPPLN
jgi:pilus assembly protein CpaB